MWDDDGIENLELAEVLLVVSKYDLSSSNSRCSASTSTLLPYYRTTLPSYYLTISPSCFFYLAVYLTQVLGLDVDDLNRLEQVCKIISK